MSERICIYTLIALVLLLFDSCRKPYAPPAIISGASHLVVEGSINTGADSAIMHLTHTIPISTSSSTPQPAELNAIVSVESDANMSYPLSEIGNGYYASAGLNLSSANKCKLDTFLFFNPVTKQNDVDLNIYHGDAIPVLPLGPPGPAPERIFSVWGNMCGLYLARYKRSACILDRSTMKKDRN